MVRYARVNLTTAQFIALHHCALELARKRGVRRVPVGKVLQEAVAGFLAKEGFGAEDEEPSGISSPCEVTP